MSINITGSWNLTGAFTASAGFEGTASYATNALTASYAMNGGGGAAFPFSGSAVITGSLEILGQLSSPTITLTQANTTSSYGATGSFVKMDCASGSSFEINLTSPSASILDAYNFKEGQNITLKITQGTSSFLDPLSRNLQLSPNMIYSPSGSSRYAAPLTIGQIDIMRMNALDTSSLYTTWNTQFVTQSLVSSALPTNGLELWLKPDTGQVVTSSGRVSTWYDASGNANDATQTDASARPYYTASALNGYDIMEFKGNDEINFLNYGADIWDTGSVANATTIFAVFNPDTATGNNYGAIIAQGGASRTSVAVCPQAFPDSDVKWATNNYASGGRKITGSSAVDNWYYVTWTWSDWQDRDTTTIRVNGSVAASANWDSAPDATATGNRYIGRFIDAAAGACIDGWLAELIVYRRVLSAGEITTVEAYLADKYAL